MKQRYILHNDRWCPIVAQHATDSNDVEITIADINGCEKVRRIISFEEYLRCPEYDVEQRQYDITWGSK
jgi:hypothetical protein